MNKLFTQPELKMYLENLCSPEEKFIIDEMLQLDISLRHEIEMLKEDMKMEQQETGPSPFTLNKILAYSKSFEVRNTHLIGQIDCQLN